MAASTTPMSVGTKIPASPAPTPTIYGLIQPAEEEAAATPKGNRSIPAPLPAAQIRLAA